MNALDEGILNASIVSIVLSAEAKTFLAILSIAADSVR